MNNRFLIGGFIMRTYVITVFDYTGEKLLDEAFKAYTDEEAKEISSARLEAKGYSTHTHRCVSEDAKLVLFHQ